MHWSCAHHLLLTSYKTLVSCPFAHVIYVYAAVFQVLCHDESQVLWHVRTCMQVNLFVDMFVCL